MNEFNIIGLIIEKTMKEAKTGKPYATFSVNDFVTKQVRKSIGCFFPDQYNKVEIGDFVRFVCETKKEKFVNVREITKLADKAEAEVHAEESKAVSPVSALLPTTEVVPGIELGHATNEALTVIANNIAFVPLPDGMTEDVKGRYERLSKIFFRLNKVIKKDLEDDLRSKSSEQ